MSSNTKSALEIRRLTSVARTLFPLFREISEGRWIDRSGLEIERFVDRYLRRHGLESVLEGYKTYRHCSSVSVNSTAVHGLPSDRTIHRGDVFTVDVVASSGGYVSDTAWTFITPGASRRVEDLYDRAWRAFRRLLMELRAGISLEDLAECASGIAEAGGIRIVPSLLGHGIGREMHESPVLTFVPTGGPAAREIRLEEGTILNIEPVFTDGSGELKDLDDGWGLATRDGAPTVHFELSIEVRDSEVLVLQLDRMSAREIPERIPFGRICE